jgi:hypothetical protein
MFYSSSLLQFQVAGSKIVYVYVHEHEHVYGRATELKSGPEGQILVVTINIAIISRYKDWDRIFLFFNKK